VDRGRFERRRRRDRRQRLGRRAPGGRPLTRGRRLRGPTPRSLAPAAGRQPAEKMSPITPSRRGRRHACGDAHVILIDLNLGDHPLVAVPRLDDVADRWLGLEVPNLSRLREAKDHLQNVARRHGVRLPAVMISNPSSAGSRLRWQATLLARARRRVPLSSSASIELGMYRTDSHISRSPRSPAGSGSDLTELTAGNQCPEPRAPEPMAGTPTAALRYKRTRRRAMIASCSPRVRRRMSKGSRPNEKSPACAGLFDWSGRRDLNSGPLVHLWVWRGVSRRGAKWLC
jgi:hypothetical protein